MLELWWPALLLTAGLAILLVPYGREVVGRGVIFLDLAVGQWAALGAALGSIAFGTQGLWLGALLGAFVAASWVRSFAHHAERIQVLEAPIGLLYALGLALFMILQANAGSQREVLSALVAYDVLFATPEEALFALAVALVSGLLWWHWLWLRTSGFYWGFALVCAIAVKLAGLLVVFVLLLAPAFLWQIKQGTALWIITSSAIVLAWSGLGIALWLDYPAGYTLVALLSSITLIIRWIHAKKNKIDKTS
jgi:zinc/manganese transport system permease protein